ncbi:MAG TPA: beta-propeller fold lactonase family protein [Candidatus Sulfotelmatobacter sp.]
MDNEDSVEDMPMMTPMMTPKIKALLTLILAALVLVLSGCGGGYACKVTFGSSTCNSSGSGITGGGSGGGSGGGGGGGTTVDASKASSLVYYMNGSNLAAAGLSGTTLGALTSFTAPALPSSADNMTIVNKQFVYVPMGDTTVQAFNITRSTGALTAIASSPFTVSGGGTADGAWADPLGRFLFVGSESTAAIWVFNIDATTGALTEVSGSPFNSPSLVTADIITVDANGKFIYVGQGFDSATAEVDAFAIDQTTGALTEVAGAPFQLGVAQIHASPIGEYLLGVQEIQDNPVGAIDPHIYVFSINPATGVPTAVAGSPFLTSAAPIDFAISPNGQFVYTVGVDATTKLAAPLEGFQMNVTTGALTSLGAPFTTLPKAAMCQFEQTGADLYCADNLLGGTTIFVLGANPSTGALANVASLPATPFAFAVTD